MCLRRLTTQTHELAVKNKTEFPGVGTVYIKLEPPSAADALPLRCATSLKLLQNSLRPTPPRSAPAREIRDVTWRLVSAEERHHAGFFDSAASVCLHSGTCSAVLLVQIPLYKLLTVRPVFFAEFCDFWTFPRSFPQLCVSYSFPRFRKGFCHSNWDFFNVPLSA